MAALLVFLFSAANAASGICHPNAYLGMMDCFLAGAAGVFRQECSQCEQLCVEWSWSVGRFPSPPHAAVVVLALSSLATDRPRPRDRPTDRPTDGATEECSPSASLCLSAGSPPGCYVRWRYPPPFSIWSSQRFTNRSAERKRWVPQTLMFSYQVL